MVPPAAQPHAHAVKETPRRRRLVKCSEVQASVKRDGSGSPQHASIPDAAADGAAPAVAEDEDLFIADDLQTPKPASVRKRLVKGSEK